MSFPKIISIEGNIGAGKTTIIEQLEKQYKDIKSILVVREPVNVWETIKDSDGETILEKFYKNPEKYAFSFQVMAFVTRLSLLRNLIKENPECKLIICERSLEADKNIFAKMLYDDKMIDEINYKIYMKFYNEYKSDFTLNGLVYIHAEEDVCYNRVHKRNRTGEESVSLEYLKKCKEYHQDWLVNKKNILVINANYDVDYNAENPNDKGVFWIKLIKNYIDKIMTDDHDGGEYEYSDSEDGSTSSGGSGSGSDYTNNDLENDPDNNNWKNYLFKNVHNFLWKF
jgi:deoxyadenosine/deoxycytidine kinase